MQIHNSGVMNEITVVNVSNLIVKKEENSMYFQSSNYVTDTLPAPILYRTKNLASNVKIIRGQNKKSQCFLVKGLGDDTVQNVLIQVPFLKRGDITHATPTIMRLDVYLPGAAGPEFYYFGSKDTYKVAKVNNFLEEIFDLSGDTSVWQYLNEIGSMDLIDPNLLLQENLMRHFNEPVSELTQLTAKTVEHVNTNVDVYYPGHTYNTIAPPSTEEEKEMMIFDEEQNQYVPLDDFINEKKHGRDCTIDINPKPSKQQKIREEQRTMEENF
jgi:hypothetical protein